MSRAGRIVRQVAVVGTGGTGTGSGVTVINTVNNAMSGTVALDFNSLTFEEIIATQTGAINFTKVAGTLKSFAQKWIKLTTTTGQPTFSADFEEKGAHVNFRDGLVNDIILTPIGGKIQYVVTQKSSEFLGGSGGGTGSSGGSGATDPLMAIPNIGGYWDASFTSSVDTNAFSVNELSTLGTFKYLQATAGLRPTFLVNKLNFPDNTRYLSPTGNITYSKREFSIAIVVDDLWTTDKMILGFPVDSSASNNVRVWFRSGSIQMTVASEANYIWSTLPTSTGTKKLINIIGYNDSGTYKIKLRINGVDHATIHTNSWSAGLMDGNSLVGNDLYVKNKGFVGNIYAMIRTNGTPSPTNIALIESTLTTRHGIA